MSCASRRSLALLITALLLSTACAEPPTKEMDQAQGAIEAARAAGADRYAADELKAATDALTRAHEAAAQRDYRQSLSLALDAKERAQDAARTGAERMAQRRSEADQALANATRALAAAKERLASSEGTRLPAAQQTALRTSLEAASHSLQEARTAFETQGFQQAQAGADAALTRIRQAMTTLSDMQMRAGRRAPARR